MLINLIKTNLLKRGKNQKIYHKNMKERKNKLVFLKLMKINYKKEKL